MARLDLERALARLAQSRKWERAVTSQLLSEIAQLLLVEPQLPYAQARPGGPGRARRMAAEHGYAQRPACVERTVCVGRMVCVGRTVCAGRMVCVGSKYLFVRSDFCILELGRASYEKGGVARAWRAWSPRLSQCSLAFQPASRSSVTSELPLPLSARPYRSRLGARSLANCDFRALQTCQARPLNAGARCCVAAVAGGGRIAPLRLGAEIAPDDDPQDDLAARDCA
eukprot:3146196-Pleurochrysis_carterae.AAC.1